MHTFRELIDDLPCAAGRAASIGIPDSEFARIFQPVTVATDPLVELSHELNGWYAREDLEPMCAMDALCQEGLTGGQREYLEGFVARWDAAEAPRCASCGQPMPGGEAGSWCAWCVEKAR